MSYRELKQFTEIMRTLGYPHPVGIDSFDSPNFGLMASLLQWLSALYDPDIVILPDLTSEHSRVEFVKSVVQQMAIRSAIRLNPRKLYTSDRFAVRELLKIAAPIYRGIVQTNISPTLDQSAKQNQPIPPSVQKISQLSSTVPKHSVELYDELDKELQIRETRQKVLSTMPPLDEVEKSVLVAVESASTRLETLTKELDRLNNDEDTLKSKIKQRKHELDRQSKRLMSVQTIRPAFMDEYEQLEQELSELFKTHFQHYRNVDFYEHEIQKQDEKRKKENEQREKNLHKIRKRVNKVLINSVQNSVPEAIRVATESGDDIMMNAGEVNADSDDSF